MDTDGRTDLGRVFGLALLICVLCCPASASQQPDTIYSAIGNGDTKKFASFVEAGAVKDLDELLLYVTNQREKPTVEMVQLLLDKGARVNQPGPYRSALMRAAGEGHLEIAKLLLARGAEVNSQSDDGTALMMAVRGGHPEIVKLLLDAGAEVNRKHRTGRTALMMSATRSVRELNPPCGAALPPPSSEIMNLLLAKGADANLTTEYGETALMEANSAGKVRLLVAHGAQVNAADKEGQSALVHAVERKEAEVVEALLQAGADSAVQDEHGETLLMRAAELGGVEIVKSLLARGADVNYTDALGNTAYIVAYENSHPGVQELLKSWRPKTKATRNALLRAAVAKKDSVKVGELLKAGADPNYEYSIGHEHKDIKSTVLILAVRVGDVAVVEALLAAGANPNTKGLVQGSEHGLKFGTALDAAQAQKNEKLVSLLRRQN